MRDFIVGILGTYTPRSVVVDGVTVYLTGLASIDWEYIFTGLALLIVIFCVFKAIGAFLCKIF